MTKLLALLVVSLAACGGSKSTTDTTGPTGGPGEQAIDPTLPSWAPESCTAYQKAVFQALSCDAIEQGKRDEIQATYAAASESWKAEQNADAAKIDEVSAFCVSGTDAVRVESADKCTANPNNTN